MAKFEWDGLKFNLIEKENIKAGDFMKKTSVIDDNSDIIVKRWNEFFNK